MRIKLTFGGFLKFKKIDPSAKIEYPAMKGDAGYDIGSVEEKIIPAKSSAIIRTGIALEIPEDYFGLIRTRSGYGVKNTMQLHHGLIDSGYRNEITVRVYNHGNQDYKVSKGDKICQLVLFPKVALPIKEVNNLDPADRGLRGLGSTGK